MQALWLGLGIFLSIAICFLVLPVIRWKYATMEGQQPFLVKKAIVALIVGSLLFVAIAVLLYWHWGSSAKLAEYYAKQQQAAVVNKVLQELKTPDQVIKTMREHLQRDPNSAKGWYLLGRLYASQAQYKEASEAFAKANALQPNDNAIMFQYAQALYFTQQKLTEQADKLVQQILKTQPDNDEAINLLAIAAFEAKDYQKAVNYWEMLLPKYPPSSEDGQKLLQIIAKAQAELKAQTQSAATIKIPVRVELDPNLRKLVLPDNTVFIYARAVNGPPMPLAIIRKQVKDLPVEVVLDDTMSMLSSLKLKDYKEIKIIARVAKFNQAIPQQGDLIGESSALSVDAIEQPIKVKIERTIM